jgi:hypothetical protein
MVEATHNSFCYSSGNPQSAQDSVERVPTEIDPGNRICIKGPHHGKPSLGKMPKGAGRYLPAMVEGSSARAGLIVQNPAGDTFLTTVSHLVVMHNELVHRGEKAYGLELTNQAVVGTEVRLAQEGEPVCNTYPTLSD